jgi:hypothetical protein
MKRIIIRRIITLDQGQHMVMVFYDDGNDRKGGYTINVELSKLIKFSGWDNLSIPAECTETGSTMDIIVDFSKDFPGKSEYIVAKTMEE